MQHMNLLRSTISLVLLLTALLVVPAVSQTVMPQKPDPPKADDATRIGLVTPRVSLLGGGGSVVQETTALQQSIGSFLTGPRIGTVNLRAKLDSLALEEGKERFCDYVLYVSLTRNRPGSARAGGSYGTGAKAGDDFNFSFKVVSTSGQQNPVERTLKGTASADGQDVLTPMIETVAQIVVELAKVAKPARPQPATVEATTTTPAEVTKSTPTAPSEPAVEKAPTGYGA